MVARKVLHKPVPKSALPAFTPVPRKLPRHDGWTPERQRYFIAALADTGCVAIAARMVNMSKDGAYQLRRQPGAESFRAAWDAAQTLGLQPVKDEAFDRAMNGELIPVFVGGKLMGFRRKKNDRLLMFILRHYGQDAAGRKTTINYFSTRATAGAATTQAPPRDGEGDRSPQANGGGGPEARALAAAETSTTTVKTVISGQGAPSQRAADTAAANVLTAFEGVQLDAEAQAEIYRSLEACAERRRALEADPEHDPERVYIGEAETNGYLGQLESGVEGDWVEYRPEGEHSWENLGEGGTAAEIDAVVAGIEARKAAMTPEEWEAQAEASRAAVRADIAAQSVLPKPEPDPDDPRLDWRNWEAEARQDQGADAIAAPHLDEEPGPACPERSRRAGQPAPKATGLTSRTMVRDGPTGAPEKPKRTYKPRKPKPPFTPWEGQACPELVEEAIEQVEAERREAAAAEAERRKRRKESLNV